MKRSFTVWITLLFIGVNVLCQSTFQTIAEKSDFTSTSDYEDVMTFIDHLKKSSPYIRVENIATSAEGREIPLLIIGNPLPENPEDLLNLHGIKFEKLKNDAEIEVEKFNISELIGSERLNQGHYTNTIEGQYLKESIDFPAGTIVVRTDQPLANVAAYLLEPQSNDGMMTWNFFDRYLVPQWGMGYYPYPVYKVLDRTDLKTIPSL